MINILFSWLIIWTSMVNLGTENSKTDFPRPERSLILKILSYNVRNCVGLDRNTDYSRVADIILRINADVVAIQELDSSTTRSKGVVVLNELASKSGMVATYSSSIDFQGGKYGVGILTREKPVSWQKIPLPGNEEKRSLLIVELKEFVICCTHLSLTREDRLTSVEIINKATERYSKPVVLAGDLNAEANSVELNSLQRNWLILNNPLQLTFPANDPNKCIDFILLRKNNKYHASGIDTKVDADNEASDHRPVWVSFSLFP